ncbi:hypothetical protein ANANG_G00282740 [Anguilla anguilla]|uniref:Sperm-specific antigen 2 C-terminal domain-containing protein n=1 Tax=Anguilla anguilla TaxID=7936 RepID=A0A9D3LN66_ANGAN|nr:hypothetical protein ANANG_G00282740 [Anguilla anguilla]
MRMARQQPVGSGFTGEPSTDASAHRFKVQESSDSCGSGNTVMPSPGDPETPVLQNSSLQNDQECLPPTPIVPLHLQVLRRGQSVSQDQEQVPEPSPHHIFKSTDEEVQNIKPPTSNQRVPVMEASYLTLQRAELKASFVHDEQVQKAWAWARDLRRAGGRPSLPADPASATCMDSSLRISGTAEPLSTSTQCFTLVNGQGEAGAMTEEAEEKQNSLPSMSRVMHEVASRVRPYPLLYTPSYLSRNYSPLQSAPSGWAMQGLGTPLQQTRPSALLSSTEMYLKRVLQDIQNTVQNLAQRSSLLAECLSVPSRGPQDPVMALYKTTFEEVQQMRRSLNVFRTQMMDLELTLMRQHDQVYHHLTQQEREEAEQLQYLRSAVRYQLLQVELQQDERLFLLHQQMRFPRLANLYRHPMGIHGHGLDRLYSASRVPLTEPVSRLLQEQVSLWRDLGSKSAAGSTLSWGVHCSPSSATGPSSTWAHGVCTPERFPMTRTGVFPTSVCLSPTPTTQPTSEKAQEMEYLYLQRERGGAQNPHQWEEMGRRAESFHQWEKREGRAESIHQWEKSGGGAESFLKQEEKGRQPSDNVSSHHGLKEIKDDITDEVHQETVNDLLAVASPRRSHMVTKDSTFSG